MSVTLRAGRAGLVMAAVLLGSVKMSAADDANDAAVSKLPPVAKETAEKEPVTKVSADDAAAKKPAAAKKAPKKLKRLSADMTSRRDRVRRLLKALREQPFNTQQNDCGDVLEFCRGFGCDTELLDNAGTGQKVNGITCLCWNLPCAGTQMMTFSDGRLTGRVGYGYQSQPSELASVLALSQVPLDYPVRAGRVTRTVADLIEYEKLTCRAGTDMSLKLVALSHYVHEPEWKDRIGGEWTLKKMVGEELDRPPGAGDHAATNRLLGLASALNRYKADDTPIDGDLARAKTYVEQSIAYAYSSQNTDGSWGQPSNRDYAGAVSDTAHMLEWLIAAEPAARLEDFHFAQGIDFLTNAFAAQHYQSYISMMSPREISAAMHAAYVLNTYDDRVFAPADPPAEAAPAKSEKAAEKSAGLDTQAR